MHLTIVTLGSRGDIQPYVALGSGLRSAGYEVALATQREFEPMITAYGLGFREVGSNPREMMNRTDVKTIGANPIKLRQWLKEQFQEGTDNVLVQLEQALQDTDGIIFSLYGSGAYHLAEARGIPSIAAYLQPTTPTGAFPSIGVPILPGWFPLREVYNRLTHTITGALMWQLTQEALNRWRTEKLGLAPLTLKGLQQRIMNERFPMLLGYSPSVLPPPLDWPDHIHVTGYWFLEQASHWTPPSELLDFLAAGSAPIYVGFGSMVDHDPHETTQLIVNALAEAERRGVLLGGWTGLGAGDLPESIYCIDSTPHDWLFPQMAAVVHHGGTGTTAAGLRAGVPSIVTPYFADQPFWASRVYDLGVGPKPIPRKSLSSSKLAAVVESAVSDSLIVRRAAAVGEAIRAEDGVGQAVKLIQQYLS